MWKQPDTKTVGVCGAVAPGVVDAVYIAVVMAGVIVPDRVGERT